MNTLDRETIADHFKSFQDSYLKILLKFGVDKDLDIPCDSLPKI